MRKKFYSVFLVKILKKEYRLLFKIYKVERIKNKELIQNNSPLNLEKYNEKLTQILKCYSVIEKKREYCIKKIFNTYSIQNLNLLKIIESKNLLNRKDLELLDRIIRAIKSMKLKIDFLNQTNQDMIKNSLKYIQYSLDMQLRNNRKIIDFKI